MIYIGSNQKEMEASTVMLQNLQGYDGEIKSFDTEKEALNFIKTVKSPDGQSQAANLIFMSYSMEVSDGLQLLEKIIEFYSKKCVPSLEPKVIVCSSFSLQVFQEFVVQNGALGFLELPLDATALTKCCIQHGLLPSD